MSKATTVSIIRSYAVSPSIPEDITKGGDSESQKTTQLSSVPQQTQNKSNHPEAESASPLDSGVVVPQAPRPRGYPASPGSGLLVLAIQSPPDSAGRRQTTFAPGLSYEDQRAVVDNFAWFDRVDARMAGGGSVGESTTTAAEAAKED